MNEDRNCANCNNNNFCNGDYVSLEDGSLYKCFVPMNDDSEKIMFEKEIIYILLDLTSTVKNIAWNVADEGLSEIQELSVISEKLYDLKSRLTN